MRTQGRLSDSKRAERDRVRLKQAAEQLLTSGGWQRCAHARSMFRRYSAVISRANVLVGKGSRGLRRRHVINGGARRQQRRARRRAKAGLRRLPSASSVDSSGILSLYASSRSAAADPAVTACVLRLATIKFSAPRATGALSQAAAEPPHERGWRGGVAGCGDGVAVGGGGGGVHEAAVVGASVQIGDALFGDDEGELGMHG
jgi:hypothetical protein